MYSPTLLLALFALLPLTLATNPKANEYATQDCSGPLSYGHKPFCGCVALDDTTNSVYLAAGTETIYAFNDRNCAGVNYGQIGDSPPCFESSTGGTHVNKEVDIGGPVRGLLFTNLGCVLGDQLLNAAVPLLTSAVASKIGARQLGNETSEQEIVVKRAVAFQG